MRVLFARIGWMKFYCGVQPGDKKPIGGGEHNKDHLGGERFNFKNYNSIVYGSFANAMAAEDGLNLGRIQPGFKGDVLKNVLIIFFSKNPYNSDGQVVVGWHKNSTVYRNWRINKFKNGHHSFANVKNAVLLPTHNRTTQIPRGENSPGQSNTFFIYKNDGSPKKIPWLKNILNYIDDYEGENLVFNPGAEATKDIEDKLLEELEASSAQGIILNSAARRAVENRAMNSAIHHYRSLGFKVEDVSRKKSYDLSCQKANKKIMVEVKGSTSVAEKIILTYNEVRLAKKNKGKMNLYLLNSIRLTKKNKKYTATGGNQSIIKNWVIEEKNLKPIQYFYQVNKKK